MRKNPTNKTRKTKSTQLAAPAPGNGHANNSQRDRLSEPTASEPAFNPIFERALAADFRDEALLVQARIDVGLGNALYIRGHGNGLSWEKGQPLTCMDATNWVWFAHPATDKTVFKLLLNDQIWAQGQDVVVEPGRKVEVIPQF